MYLKHIYLANNQVHYYVYIIPFIVKLGVFMSYREEKDTLGTIKVKSDRLWGAQTQRSLENFRIAHHKFPNTFIKAIGYVKKACAMANYELKKLDEKKFKLISSACDEIITGKVNEHFPLSIWQTGSGTQTNMNANEVIANIAIKNANGTLGSKDPIHPNDDVNKSQSSNDTFPTFMHVATVIDIQEKLLPQIDQFITTLKAKEEEFKNIIKIGRTHLMDATPLSLAQEISGFRAQFEFVKKTILECNKHLYELAIGATAVGTGLNSHPKFSSLVTSNLAKLTKVPFIPAKNKFSALTSHEPLVMLSSSLKALALACFKTANDIRLLASGPRCAIGELILPANEPGSSIMPGKINPTQCEALCMLSSQIIGNDSVVSFAASQGHFQLNVYKPVIIHNILESITLLSDGLRNFRLKCLSGIKANKDQIEKHLNNSLMLVTALNPIIGYDKAAQIAKTAWENGSTLKEAAEKLNIISADDFDKHVRAEDMIAPKK
jgi:fumarate hydratase, class II